MSRAAGLLICLCVCTVGLADLTESLDVMSSGWPRAFFFRNTEGMATSPQVDYETWERHFERLQGIEGKVLEEEVPGRSVRNPTFFTRFKERHPRQLVLLHYNGNSRDPRDSAPGFFAGHWVYYTGCGLTRDLPAVEGECEIHVEDATLFRTNMGRYGDKNEDIGLCMLDENGRPDWHRSEQVELLATDPVHQVITVKRGCFGTRPQAFPAGKAYVAAHATEGPWGQRSNLMWYYNYSSRCPQNSRGQTCTDVLVDYLAGLFADDGLLQAFDGVEFDVLGHEKWQGVRGGRGLDLDADGRADGGFFDGVNEYGIGVYEFCRALRQRVGEDLLLLADGHGPGHQRAFGQLNGIESEGWPALNDFEVRDWSGGLNRHMYWAQFGREPQFNYINHKFLDGGEGKSPTLPFSRHRLVLAACQFVDAALTYSFQPPREKGGLFPIWDELWKGEEQTIAWLGMPKGAARHLALEAPDLLEDAGKRPGRGLLARYHSSTCRAADDGGALRIEPNSKDGTEVRFDLTGIHCPKEDIFVAITMRGQPMAGYPADIARLTWVGLKLPGDLISQGDPPRSGVGLRGKGEGPIDGTLGADVKFQFGRSLAGDPRDAYLCHPPWRTTDRGYTFWERDLTVPAEGVLRFAIGMGQLSPERSDGVVFRVLLREGDREWTELFARLYNEFRWQDEEVALAAWAGRDITLRFVTDCGPQDNPTTDHSAWADARVVSAGEPDTPVRAPQTMTWTGRGSFTSTFAFPGPEGREAILAFEVEGGEPVWVEEVSIHASPDAMVREYDNGAVLANPGVREFSFDIASLFPGRSFRRLRGTVMQDREANSGEVVAGEVTLGERDALFLVAE